jgi:hypothetical protein
MSSAVVSTSAALGRPFVFEDEADAEVRPFSRNKKPSSAQESAIAQIFPSTIKNQKTKIPLVTPASQLNLRPAPAMVSSGISALDALTGGLPRGGLTEVCGSASSGRTTLLMAALAAATRRGEFCVVVDASDALDPQSAAAAGVELERLLWVRCSDDPPKSRAAEKASPSAFAFDRAGSRPSEHRLEQVLRATDLLLESGGFGLIVLDLSDLPPKAARRIPLTTWFRFRRAVESKPTILLAIEQQPIAGSCSSLLLQLGSPGGQEALEGKQSKPGRETVQWELSDPSREAAACPSPARECRGGLVMELAAARIAPPAHAHLLTGLHVHAELIRSRLDRKPARAITFTTKTAWAG